MAVNSDRVLAGALIPAGGSLNALHLEMHIIPVLMGLDTATLYGVSVFVVPLLDPDAGATYDSIWDQQIPKDIDLAAGAFDLDTAATDTGPEFEIGEPDITAFIKGSSAPVQIARRRKLLSLANSAGKNTDRTASNFQATDVFRTTITKKVSVDVHSVALVGLSNPSLTDTTGTNWTTPAEKEISMIQYAELMLENAFIDLLGLTQAGAESPYSDALTALANYIEPDALETDAGKFFQGNIQTFTKATFDVSVPGRMLMDGPLTSEA